MFEVLHCIYTQFYILIVKSEKYSFGFNSRHWQPVFYRFMMSLKILPQSHLADNPRLTLLNYNFCIRSFDY